MKLNLPMIKEKIQFYEEVKNILMDARILYNKGAAKIKHLATLSKSLNDLKVTIG